MAAWVDLPTFQTFAGSTDANLQAAINFACDLIDTKCGPTIATTVVERVPGGGFELPLNYRAASLTSIATWPDASPVDATQFVVEDQVLFRKDLGYITADLTVTYIAGTATAPSWATAAACLIGLHWWRSRLRPAQNDPQVPVGFLVPRQAQELMDPWLITAGDLS